jgi:hypothetical protein
VLKATFGFALQLRFYLCAVACFFTFYLTFLSLACFFTFGDNQQRR